MSLERRVQPYKLLMGYDESGALSSVYVQFLDVARDSGIMFSSRPIDPVPLADAVAAGFPLADAIAYLQAALPSS